MLRTTIIILAAGSGTRMGSETPKQLLPVAGVPILVRTVRRFSELMPQANIIVVTSSALLFEWSRLSQEYQLPSHEICTGGDTRFMSVKKALDTITESDIIIVHDGVRPIVSQQLIDNLIQTVSQHGTAIPAIEPTDSFRQINNSGESISIDRSSLRAVQTPQAFRADIIQKAYATVYQTSFTDDASVVEHDGISITLCDGDRNNIKITTPHDIAIVEALLNQK